MAEHDVDEDVQQMFKKAHHVVFNHNLTESQCAALQKYYAWIRSTWCRRYQLIVNSGSEDREEETRARQEQKAKLAAMQAKMDQLRKSPARRRPSGAAKRPTSPRPAGSCATYETITRRDKADGPLVFKDTGTVVCLNFNGGRACNYKGCPGHRCSLCGVASHGAQACGRSE
ncbi:unnamed protein product [Tilletia caries]|nr:unnamed protein product [Tilletia caries]